MLHVVVPWDFIIAEKREQLVSVLFQTLLNFRCSVTLPVAFADLAIESLHKRQVLLFLFVFKEIKQMLRYAQRDRYLFSAAC